MNKKGSMELSVNSIVILVIAIVMMGLILGFVKTKFGDLDKQLVGSEPEAPKATASDPLTISRETLAVSPGEDVIVKVQAYAISAITATDLPTITCSDLIINAVSITGRAIPAGESGGYIMKIPVKGAAARGTYLCQLSMTVSSSTKTKDIVIKVV
jgi:hypothetical protein